MAEPADVAPYLELIRTELELTPDADPIAELDARLSPDDPRDRPPARAPAVLRLGRALWSLRRHRSPAASLDTFTKDLRVLKLFDPCEPWTDDSLERLLSDVRTSPKRSRGKRATDPSVTDPKIVRLKRQAPP